MSDFAPLAVMLIAGFGALALACVEQVVAGARPSPVRIARDAVLSLREPIARPQSYDGWLFHLAPALLLLSAIAALAMVPWAPGFRGIEVESGAIVFAAALAYVTPAVFMAGWGSGRPLAVVGAFRFLALMLGYAMPIAMITTAVAAPAGSLAPAAIVEVQHAVPMALVQPYSLALWLPAVMAVALLAPFDVATAPGELGGAGVFSRYTGLEAALVALARRVLLLAVAGMTAALFLGGWHGPLLPDALWMALKTLAVGAGLLWAGRVFPRVENDRLVAFAWTFAVPASIGAIALAGLTTLLFYR